jgi:acetolactate synthase I/II/III large subunit
VLLSHLGPGLTNAATGVANAALDSIPMVVIAGDVPSHYYGKHPHQEVNLHGDARSPRSTGHSCKRVWRVERPDLFPEIIEKAFQMAESGRPGPVLVSVPMDIFSMEVDTRCSSGCAAHTRPAQALARRTTAERIVRTLLDAQRPLIYAGGGVLLADAARNCASSRRTCAAGGAFADGQGRAARRPPADLGMTGFWGTRVRQRPMPARRLGDRPGHPLRRSRLQFLGARSSPSASRPPA